MSESQSFIETTLPPGYGFAQWERGEWRWHSGDHVDRFGCLERHTCCRRAWRHWTATVLRGRDVRWYGETEGLNKTARFRGERTDVQVCRYFGSHAAPKYQGALEVSFCGGVFRDVDEAMARFAALVLATEGMVPR